MTSIIAPVIPGSGSAVGLADVTAVAEASRLPLPVPVVREPSTALGYGIARIDRSGRLCVRPVLDRLGWSGAVRLAAAVVGTSVVMHPASDGVFALGSRRTLVLPVILRRRCGLSAGDGVLLAADPVRGVLVVHPLRSLERLVLGYHASLLGGDDDAR
ncbi:hypothetical protein AB0878_36570 [Amycolatopsis sp. NPDC047767]|uniref:hypothetical protein n=1 Tax=Amycolatopsis sp. NPDC047767 TaxID=3156765 RepID=UPI003454AD4E